MYFLVGQGAITRQLGRVAHIDFGVDRDSGHFGFRDLILDDEVGLRVSPKQVWKWLGAAQMVVVERLQALLARHQIHGVLQIEPRTSLEYFSRGIAFVAAVS